MHNHLHFFILFFFVFSARCDDSDSLYTNCKQPFKCGNVTNLAYPFWGGLERPQHCGRSGFELTNCENSTQLPRFKSNKLDFHVLNITNEDSSNSHTITLARTDLWDSPCTQTLVNTTLNYTLFSYVQTIRNLTLYYGCVSRPNQLSQIAPNNFTCRIEGKSSNLSYYLDDSLSRVFDANGTLCEVNIRVPIVWEDFDEMPENATEEVEGVLRKGFEVEYSADWELCRGCLSYNGICVSNATTDSFLCLCGDDELYSNATACPFVHGT